MNSSRIKSSRVQPAENEGVVVTRAFKIFRVEPHPRRKLLILLGEINISIVDDLGEEMVAEETRDYRKVIRMDNLKEDTDSGAIVEEVTQLCPFMDPEIIGSQLIPMIEVLKNRRYDKNGVVIPEAEDASDSGTLEASFQDLSDYFDDIETEGEGQGRVDLEEMDRYVELLYEELQDKAKGARCIYQLCKKNENLATILLHETALNAVFRTLREDYKKSMSLTTNILGICNCYAQFSDFHERLINDKICSLTFDIIEFELERYGMGLERIQEQKDLVEAGERTSAKRRLDKMREKFLELTRRQDNLLKVAFEVVLRLSEEKIFQREIVRRGIVRLLMEALDRKHSDLLLIVVKFLKNLSIYAEAKVQMSQGHIIERITPIFSQNACRRDLAEMTIRLMYNLAFDTKCRHKMIKFGLLPNIATHFADPTLESITLKLLYIFSMDRTLRPRMASTGIVRTIMKLILEKPTDLIEVELSSLAINLAANKHCAKEMCEGEGLRSLLGQAFANQDVLVMKIVRNLSLHEGDTKALFIDFTSDLANAVCQASSEEFILECLGTLGNLTLSNIDFRRLLIEFQLVPWLKSKILSGAQNGPGANSARFPGSRGRALPPDKLSPEDFLLEVVIFVGTCCGDPECGDLLIKEGVIELLINLFQRRTRDTLLRIHILYAFYKLSQFTETRLYLVERSKIPQILLDLLRDPQAQIKELSESTLDLIGEYNETWRKRVQTERYNIHNEHWLDVIARDSLGSEVPGGELDDHMESEHNYNELDSDASETLISESETEDSPRELLNGGRTFRYDDQGSQSRVTPSIFDRFRHQYEQERLDKEELLEYGIIGDQEDDIYSKMRIKTLRGDPKTSRGSHRKSDRVTNNGRGRTAENGAKPPEIHNPMTPTIPTWI